MMPMNALVFGFGASGQSAFELLQTKGYHCYIYDDLNHKLSLEQIANLTLDLAILSPGISPTHPVVELLKEKKVKLNGEADFALSCINSPLIAITGTNGKTTVTLLCEHVLKECGIDALACGNVSQERALSKIALDNKADRVLVVELSSFQLETLKNAHFLSAIILNITPDHLDRYKSIEAYAEAKCHLMKLSKMCFVHKSIASAFDKLIDSSATIYDLDEKSSFLDSIESSLDRLNALSAFLVLKPFNISEKQFLEAYKSFKKPSHRLEFVKKLNEVVYINDSKATNIDATIQALKNFKQSVILLAGGVDKGHPYSTWIPELGGVKEVVCFGQAKEKIYDELSHHVMASKHQSLKDAITYARKISKAGDIVLLSPGGSSFDEFKDYKHRGDVFCQSVNEFTEN